MHALIAPLIALHRVKMVKIGSVVFELKSGRKWKLWCDSAENGRYSFIWHTVVLKRIGISQFWFQPVNGQSCLYSLWKFGEIQNSDPGVLDERSCTAGVDNWDGAVRHTWSVSKCFSQVFARRRHYGAERVYARLCYAFSSFTCTECAVIGNGHDELVGSQPFR